MTSKIRRMTKMTASLTLLFSDIFKDYNEFKSFTDQFDLVNSNEAELFNQRLYYLLYNRYVGCDLAYTSRDTFIAEFGIAYQQYFTQAIKKLEYIKKINNLTAKDMEILAETISNFSNAPNKTPTDPFEELPYISSQNRGRSKANKLTAYLTALRNMPDAQLDFIIGQFDYLWLDVLLTDNKYLY